MAINAINAGTTQNSAKAKIEYFINLSDEELLYLAQKQTLTDKKACKQQNVTRTLAKTIPVVDSMVAVPAKIKALGFVGLGSLSTSLTTFVGRLGTWTLCFLGFDILDKLFNKATEKSKKIADIDEKHPMAKPLTEMGLMFGAYTGAKKYKNQLISLIPKSLKKKVIKKVDHYRRKIDKSDLSEKVYKPLLKRFAKGAKKYPKLAAVVTKIRPLVVPVMIAAMLIKTIIIDPLAYSKKVINNYTDLKAEQEIIKTALEPNSQEISESYSEFE